MNPSNMIPRRCSVSCCCLAAALACFALPDGRAAIAENKSISSARRPVLVFAEATETKKEKKSAAEKAEPNILKYGDGTAEGKKSIGGSGEMIRFELPEGVNKVTGIKIHASRYGYPQAPKEDFEVTFVKD